MGLSPGRSSADARCHHVQMRSVVLCLSCWCVAACTPCPAAHTLCPNTLCTPCSLPMLSAHALCPCCLPMLSAHALCPHTLCTHAVCPCRALSQALRRAWRTHAARETWSHMLAPCPSEPAHAPLPCASHAPPMRPPSSCAPPLRPSCSQGWEVTGMSSARGIVTV